MGARFIVVACKTQRHIGQVFELEQGVVYVIGRPPNACGAVSEGRRGILINADGLTRAHAFVEPHGDTWTVRDFVSSQGTFVNGERVDPKEPRVLRDRDLVNIGDAATLELRLAE